ncbi:MAG TPA: MFS transporter [Candidatus Dormibacteraeota bacterium]|nr:MFS transporter [Candidatus Dormibacteraeota bacterium]
MAEPRPTESRSALFGIVAGIFVSGTGIGSLLPILPLYLRERGASYGLVGVIVGAALIAQAVGQWPAGFLAERVGAKAMMIGGLLVAAAASLTFIIPLPVEWLIGLRFVQGLGFAAVIPAQLAAVADVVPRASLGRAYGWVSGAQQAGFIGGPAIGGFLAVFGRWTVFAVTGAALLAAAAVIAVTLRTSARPSSSASTAPRSFMTGSSRARSALIAVAILSIGLGLLIGIYDVIWSLYMRTRGASDPVVGLSFTLFALPLLIATPLAGWSSDRWDRRWLAVGSVVLGSLMGPIYPNLTSIPAIVFVGLFEGSLWAFTTPSMNSFLMDAVAERRAEAQGIVGTALSSATAVGSLVGGALFAFGVAIPFLAAAAAGVVFSLAALPWMLSAGARRRAPEAESA